MDEEIFADKAAQASQVVHDTIVAPEGDTSEPVDVDG